MNIQLTDEQKEVVDLMTKYLDSPTDFEPFTLVGIGGAGKTTVVKYVIENRSNVVGATVSHSAKFVLENSLKGFATCFTIAQLLGLKQYINEDGEITFAPATNINKILPIENADILVIDECSMIDVNTFNFIMKLRPDNCKVIFMGDPYQLPPVENTKQDSVTFKYEKAELLKPMRYTGPIADLGQRIRTEIDNINANENSGDKYFLNYWQVTEEKNSCRTSRVNEDGSGYIFLNDIDDVINIAVNNFKENVHDADALRLMAYKNSSISTINNVIRLQLYGNGDEEAMQNVPQYMPGELVICEGGYNVYVPWQIHPVQVIYNNETFRIKGTLPVTGPSEIPSLSLDLEPSPMIPHGSRIITLDWENGRYDYFDLHNQIKKEAKDDGRQWPRYYKFKEQWAWFEYAYAINAYRG